MPFVAVYQFDWIVFGLTDGCLVAYYHHRLANPNLYCEWPHYSMTALTHMPFFHFGDTKKLSKRLRWRWMAVESMNDVNETAMHAQRHSSMHASHRILYLSFTRSQSTRPTNHTPTSAHTLSQYFMPRKSFPFAFHTISTFHSHFAEHNILTKRLQLFYLFRNDVRTSCYTTMALSKSRIWKKSPKASCRSWLVRFKWWRALTISYSRRFLVVHTEFLPRDTKNRVSDEDDKWCDGNGNGIRS